jgi:hypothetical protein
VLETDPEIVIEREHRLQIFTRRRSGYRLSQASWRMATPHDFIGSRIFPVDEIFLTVAFLHPRGGIYRRRENGPV